MVEAYESKYEERAWDIYVSIYPNMNKETFIPFEEFYKPSTEVKVENKSEDKILMDVKNIIDNYRGEMDCEVYLENN